MLSRSVWMGLIFLMISSHPSFSQQKNAKNQQKKGTKTKILKSSQRKKILAYALRYNPGLRAFQARIQRAKAKLKGTRVFPNNPVLSGGGGSQFPANSTPASGQSSPILPRVEAGLSLALPVGGRWGKTQQLASSQLAWIQRLGHYRRFQLSLRVHQALNRVAMAQRIQKKRLAIVSFFQRTEGFVQKRMKHGTATQLDLQLAQTSRLRAQQAVLSATLQTRLMRQRLGTLAGWTPSKRLPWHTIVIPAFAPLPKKALLLSKGLRSHVRIRLAEAMIHQSKAMLALSKARAIPDLTFSLGYALEDNNHIVRGSVSIPLPLFWRNQSAVGQNHARFRRARLLLVRQRFLVRQRILRAHTSYQANLRTIRLFKKQFQSVKARSQLIEKGLREGSFSVFQVLTAQRSVLQSELLYLQNIQRTHESYIRLCRSAGFLPVYKGVFQP